MLLCIITFSSLAPIFILHIVFELFANVRKKSATLTAAWHYVIVKDGKTSSCGVVSTLS